MAGLQWLCGMLEHKANKSGYYPNLHVGMADELTDEDQFLGKSILSVKSIQLLEREDISLEPIEDIAEKKEV